MAHVCCTGSTSNFADKLAPETNLATVATMAFMASRVTALALGPLLAIGCGTLALLAGLPHAAAWTAAVAGLCATWWVLEPLPVPATSLVPFAVFPLVGVLDHEQVAVSYGHTIILLLLGGFLLSTAVESSGLHRRIALFMVRLAGGGGRRLVLGFMLASALCSMWISNTATVLMLLPVALAVLESEDAQATKVPLLLGIAYGASIGGLGTPIGTPPNLLFLAVYEQRTGVEVSFLDWMSIGVPAVVLMLPCAWLLLTRRLPLTPAPAVPRPGPWTPGERRIALVFGATALAWIFRTEPLGGWSGLVGAPGASDATVALAAVVLLFIIPDGRGSKLLTWERAQVIPWGLLLLFGGGIALSAGFAASGLSAALGAALGSIAHWPLILVTLIICLAVTFMTEVTSNTATASLLLPILYAAAMAAGLEPTQLMVPATLSASCAFMLPVATAPNAIVSATPGVTTAVMAREGILLNLIGVGVVTMLAALLL